MGKGARRGHRLADRYSAGQWRRIYKLEDKWFETLFNDNKFKKAVSDLRTKLLINQPPALITQPEHHCTVHRHDPTYACWDAPIDNLCEQFGIDEGFDLYYGPRYRIERHVLFDEPIGNLFHHLIRCETDPSPVPHISKISVLPPERPLSTVELNWLLADLEFLIVERQPIYPITPSESSELFGSLKGKNIDYYKIQLDEAIAKHIIADPAKDVGTLIALIEILRDEQGLFFKEIGELLNLSAGAVQKRYKRATFMPPGVGIRFMPTPRKRRA